MSNQRDVSHCRRIVVKAGTTTLTSEDGNFSLERLEKLGEEILGLLERRNEVVLVSSGAIARGMELMGFAKRPKEMARLQACAAIGQGKLIHDYENFFSRKKIHTAQLLLTRDGLEDRERFLKARQTFQELLRMKILPIVNENDTVATEEIRFGDNDVLSVQVAHLVHADRVVLLSDVDGFYLQDGSRIRRVSSVEEIDGTLVKHLKDRHKARNVGGMRAKLEAAKVAMRLGIPMQIVDGGCKGILEKIVGQEDVGTLFMPAKERANARKKWIAFSAARKGTVVLDDGAALAVSRQQRSLLASGIRGVRGAFERGAVIELEDLQGRVFGRGVARFSSEELKKIVGKSSQEIRSLLPGDASQSVIHRNDLVVWGQV